MLPRSKRLTVSLFTNALANGKVVHSTLFTARIAKNPGPTRFSAVISKKITKTAVERNKLRRRIYSAVASFGAKISKDHHVILLAKPLLSKSTLKDIVADIETLFVKSHLLK